MSNFELFGWFGAIFLLSAYGLSANKKHKLNIRLYLLLNLIGSLLLVINAYFIKSYPFLLVNLIWAGISTIELFVKNNTDNNELS